MLPGFRCFSPYPPAAPVRFPLGEPHFLSRLKSPPKNMTMKRIPKLLPMVTALAMSTHLFAAAPSGGPQPLSAPDQVPDGLAKSDWTSIRAAYEAGRHAFQPTEGGWQARNPGQQWLTKFDSRGFVAQPNDNAWQWGLELKSYGFPGNERAISGVPTVTAAGQRLTYQWAAGVQEWFVNDQRGLEHGFTLTERPSEISNFKSQISNPLAFTLAVRGDLRPALSGDAQGVRFLDGHGATVLTYSGLKVWDADGKTLPSRFETAETGLRLLVDERGARYPLTIDPIAQQAYLKAGNTGAGDLFGVCVSISGDTVVVGAPEKDGTGAAYVFVRNGVAWTQQAYLKASNAGGGAFFGYAVAISGDTVVVGACQEASSTTGVNSTPNGNARYAGAAYVFVRSGITWTQQAYLKASNTGAYDSFGEAVAISGDIVVVGATFEDSSTTGVNSTPNDSGSNSGAAYIYIRSGAEWTQQAYLKASNTGGEDHFGAAVAVSDATVVVGAGSEDSSTTGVNSTPNEGASLSGAAYVFTRSGTTWSEQAYLKASNTGAGDNFGYPVAVSGDTVVVGAFGEDSGTTGVNSTPDDSAGNSGAAYVFERSGTTWSQQAYLKASNTGAGDCFGMGVGVSADTVAVGTYAEDSSSTGVNSTPNEGAANSGAAYVFIRSGTTWAQQAYLKANNSGANDYFGTWVAVSGDTVVVGAHCEDSSTTGVNSTPNDSAIESGAAYVFTGLGPSTPPIVAAPSSTQVTTTTATLGGNVTSDGGTIITARGVVFAETATNNNPQLGGTGVSNVTGTGTIGVFTVDIGSLSPGTAYSFAAYATNNVGTGYSVTGSFTTLTAPVITTATPLPAGMVGVTYNLPLAATGGTLPYAWSVVVGSPPSGLDLTSAGAIIGTPDAAGTTNFTVQVAGSDNAASTREFSLTVAPARVAPLFTSAAPPVIGIVGTAYHHTCTASGSAPITFTVSAGALPGGLLLSLEGEISGTPDTAGTFTGTITATNGILPNATQDFSIEIRGFHTLVTAATHGTVTGGGNYLHGTTATLTATGNPGYVFSSWTGDATGTANPLAVLMNSDQTITANFVPDTNDTDHDGLTNYQEIVDYHTNPEASDTDGDGFADGYEVSIGFDPAVAGSSPDTKMNIYTSVELEFGAGLGKTYRVESSTDLQTWTPVESGIVGTGGMLTRLYSIRAIPHRYFRAVRE
jgi:uncharacterized repeat protein (TIGR02543 family)